MSNCGMPFKQAASSILSSARDIFSFLESSLTISLNKVVLPFPGVERIRVF